MHRKTFTMAMTGVAALALAAGSAEAQGRRDAQGIPPGHLPPAGQCRIWYEGVPPGRQPAPMSCAEAERRAPRNARVIYGSSRDGRYDRDGRWERDDRRDRDDDRYERDGRWEDRDGRTRVEDRGRTRVDGGSSARSGDYCLDRNRDGYCDDGYRAGNGSVIRYPSRLPVMLSTRVLERGDWRATGDEWGLRDRNLRARWEDANRDGRPEQILWTDSRGRPVQRWTDTNRDGRADRIVLYENGRVVRTIGR